LGAAGLVGLPRSTILYLTGMVLFFLSKFFSERQRYLSGDYKVLLFHNKQFVPGQWTRHAKIACNRLISGNLAVMIPQTGF